ncbi:MAG TPA: GAF domain-containing sensor histidine kinase [Aggregatilinea sp.]|uniref:sensor histidine kinase n=1 Tax=Aggregatilinea sp. TaxID=2806333 RepID=UPI002C513B4B|nr:GAF domain-containing sensor histidine kinase [Aggregatilinea sp.]HML20200.1 GAF domain-containing sensor histidine kinase [Aggregatilinea sp.]
MTDQSSLPAAMPADHQQVVARYEHLLEITRQLNSTLDLGALLNRIVAAATELINTEQASILLLDPGTGELRFEAASNLSGSAMAAIPVPMEGSLAGWVATHGEPEMVNDARSDSRWFANVDRTIKFTTRNLLAVPMKIKNEVIGVLEVINKNGDELWTADDVYTLTTLASQAAIAVQNARLFQQSDFIAEIVHELRTPLAALRASTALLMRANIPEPRRDEMLRTMHEETERLTNMTTDFLDLARLESGRARLETHEFSVMELIEECVTVIREQANEHQIEIVIRGEDRRTDADRTKIKRVLLNLLTNAIKYNRDQGRIYCTLERRDDLTASCGLIVLIQDTGHGISAENQKHVFEKFYRVNEAESTTGTGLGLSIARRIIEAHGCEMGLASELNVGTTFYFTLPIAHAQPRREPPASAVFSRPKDPSQ